VVNNVHHTLTNHDVRLDNCGTKVIMCEKGDTAIAGSTSDPNGQLAGTRQEGADCHAIREVGSSVCACWDYVVAEDGCSQGPVTGVQKGADVEAHAGQGSVKGLVGRGKDGPLGVSEVLVEVTDQTCEQGSKRCGHQKKRGLKLGSDMVVSTSWFCPEQVLSTRAADGLH
jgi:hypothetical protein